MLQPKRQEKVKTRDRQRQTGKGQERTLAPASHGAELARVGSNWSQMHSEQESAWSDNVTDARSPVTSLCQSSPSIMFNWETLVQTDSEKQILRCDSRSHSTRTPVLIPSQPFEGEGSGIYILAISRAGDVSPMAHVNKKLLLLHHS